MAPLFSRRFVCFAGIGGVLAALFLAYGPALTGALLWDDEAWTTKLEGLGVLRDGAGLRTLWTSLTAAQQYYPVTATSFWVDYHLWHFWTLPYHVENVLLHAAAAGLFWRALRRLDVPGAGLAAAIFALHPLMVQSVAWIAERKNGLSLVLFLGALLAYGRFAGWWRKDGARASTASHIWSSYLLALALFAAALLAKTTACSLPAVVLLIAWWRRGKIRLVEDIGPTLPFFALGGAMARVTAWVETKHVLAQGPEWALTFPQRCAIAGRAFWFYAGKLAWPEGLSFVYPRWPVGAVSAGAWFAPAAALLVLAGLWFARGRWGRGPVVAACLFAGNLAPVLGFFDGYFMRYSFVWDHLVYLPSLAPIALAAAGVTQAARSMRAPALAALFGAVALPVLAGLTWRQSAAYADAMTLWETTLAADPDSPLANNNLGDLLARQQRREEAILHYRRAVAGWPGFAESHFNLANELAQAGDRREAIAEYQLALAIQPGDARAHNNLGTVLLQLDQVDEAIREYRVALAIEPRFVMAENNLGHALDVKGDRAGARAHWLTALALQPGFAEAHYNLGRLLRQEGRPAEAVGQLEASLRAQPDISRVENELGMALSAEGKLPEALAHFRRAVALAPESAAAENNLGNALAAAGRVDEAILHYRQALRLRPDFSEAAHNLDRALQLPRS
jgi:tetratricopeptide (TPR) repeat protein